MSFRQRNKDPNVLWRKRCRPLLLAAGLPDVLADDDQRWNYVLLHGADELGWSPQDITPQQAADMLSLLQQQYPNEVGLDLFRALRGRISAG